MTIAAWLLGVSMFWLPEAVPTAAAQSQSADASASSQPLTRVRSSEEIVYDFDTGEVTARGDVVVEQQDKILEAGEVTYSTNTQEVVASGGVRVRSEEGEFSGKKLELNLEDNTGSFTDGHLYFSENHLHVRAGTITKLGVDAYRAQDAVVTSCEGESPDWEIAGRDLEITVGGYGFVNHAFFRLREVPVLYTPYMAFPVKLERQSGLLSPSFDYSGRKGFQVSQPVYWAINDSSDATFYLNYMSRRGEKLGLEYRYVLSETDRGVAMFDYLDDRKVDDGTGTSSRDWGYTSDRYLRTNSDRYWFRMKHDQSLGASSNLLLDLDVVSDQDYLFEFRKGNSGHEATRAQFLSVFGRDIDDYNERVRKNRLGFNTQWPGYSVNAEAVWWDDVIARTQSDTDDTVQSLPTVSFDRYRQPLWGTALYAGFETEAAYLYREDGVRGQRLDLYPRLYLPYRAGNLLSIEPSVGGRGTLWRAENTDSGGAVEGTSHRELYDFKLDLSSEIYNVYNPDWGQTDALKHTAKFQVGYAYTPTVDQEEYPYFDGLDRIEGENLITYGIVSTFTTRSGKGDAAAYRQAARFEISQSYDLGLKRDGDPEPFQPIEADLQLNLGTWGRLQADAAWSTYTGRFSSRNIAYGISNTRGDRFDIQHRYSESLRETLRASATLKLTDRIWLFPAYEQNLKDRHMVSRGIDLAYRAQCWSLETRFEEEYEDDRNTDLRVGFTVTFYGLGNLGSSSQHSEGLPSWAEAGF